MKFPAILAAALLAVLARADVVEDSDCGCNVPAAPSASAKPLGGFMRFASWEALPVWHAPGLVYGALEAPALPGPVEVDAIPNVTTPVIYTDPSKPRDERVDDLIARMSLREKVSQLLNGAISIRRLNLPAYDYWNEALHGVARAGVATVFPQTIGLAATWDTPLVQTVADTIATEARGKYNDYFATYGGSARYFGLTFWTPNINLFRDPRWGRGQETYGEDTFLTARMGVAFIEGLQGDDPNYVKALACAKHFAVHSGPESTRHEVDVEPTETDFFDNYLPHFEAAVREANVGCVMSAYNRVYGASATGSPLLLTQILRNQWGFKGYVVSDCDAVADIFQTHLLVATPAEAAAVALKAGDDLNCGRTFNYLIAAAQQGLVSEADINLALHRVLAGRFQLGLFDPPEKVPFAKLSLADVDTPAHSALALQAARESMVLLKNAGVLPLDRTKVKRLAVIGPNADSLTMLLGNYNGTPSHPITILQGIRNAANITGIEVTYAPGCPLVTGYYGARNRNANIAAPDPAVALDLARQADAVIFVGGITAQLEGEEMSIDVDGFSGGDRTRIELPAVQTELLQALQALGKPVIFVNCSGSAMAMRWEADNLPAILQAWYPGENGGTAVADVLFGDYNPAGRLPITFYRGTADLPAFENYSMSNRTYRYFSGKPEFAFGHGLSFTQFKYGAVKLGQESVGATETIEVTVDVANTGERDGEEVVQIYAHEADSTAPNLPRERLCAFQRVALAKGQQVTVNLKIRAEVLRRWDATTHSYIVNPGAYELRVGAASDDIRGTVVVHVTPAPATVAGSPTKA